MNMDSNPQQDRIFECLAHQHRRMIIRIMQKADSTKTTIEIAQDVVEEISKSSNNEELSVESMQTSLYHSHLPRLKEAGIIEYEAENGLVEPLMDTSYLGVIVDITEILVRDTHQTNIMVDGEDDEQIV